MRYIIAGATAFALVAGIALGFVASRGLDGSASAAPKAQAVEVTNFPLDGNGDIRVSGVVSPSAGQLTLVAENVTIAAGGAFVSDFVATETCRGLAVFATHAGNINQSILLFSPDGTVVTGSLPANPQSSGDGSSFHFTRLAPNVAVEIQAPGSASVTIDKAWLYCAP